ncbi:hypothetical protein JQS43_16245 [Natronosporangium hydrolyticum]|uniref:Uncharacterized protein n=1 Tax=Natronosporangium hydrolyticum TaxID=2811111 RepID=A0A895YG65_9ACTN|nr:hypothetical protein [Natronosporangium hydrolyticum]QSB13180.1 hypothetical protein JQS43_16245 [Natronosporangium hydrolyticum]
MTPNPDDDRPATSDLLARLNRANPTLVVFGALAIFLGILFLPDLWGALLVLVLVGALGWLLSRTWPVLTPAARGIRLAVIALLLLVALLKLTT